MASDPYKYFRVEARELLEQLGKGVLALERDGAASEVVPRLLRWAHTLKGAARVVKQVEIAELAHALEDHLSPLRELSQSLSPQALEAVLKLLDSVGARVEALSVPVPADSGAPRPVTEESFRTLRTDVAEIDGLLEGIAAVQTSLASLRPPLAAVERARRLAGLLVSQGAAPRSPEGARSGAAARETLARLAVDLETALGGLDHAFTRGLERVERELRQVRDSSERLRLLRADTLFGSLERAVRDAAGSLGKRAVFRGAGGEIRLDGHVLGGLQPALVQLVRNAVAHGIEPSEERAAAGKPGEGEVVLEVARQGSRIVFACRDDGRGIDLRAVRRALELGGSLTRASGEPRPEELIQILLEGGLSTARTVTETAGRGIGLDVVRQAVSSLGGEVRARTQPGEGTTVELIVPVSLSSLEVLLVEAGTATVALPLEAVIETLRVRRVEIVDGQSVAHEGALIPFVSLASAVGRVPADARARQTWSAVVMSVAGVRFAVGVDRLLGTETILVRPLPVLASVDSVVGGLTLDEEGHPRLVLDPAGLRAAAGRGIPEREIVPSVALPILVVDDSLTTRMLEQSILESAGYAVDVASSGEEALEKAARQRYALFLLDIEMPGMDGFAVLEHLQANPELRDTPAVLVTSRSSEDDRRRGLQVGARAYVVKGEFDQVQLLSRIRSLVG